MAGGTGVDCPYRGTIRSVAAAIRMTTQPGEGIIVQPPVYYRYKQAADRIGRKTIYNPLKMVGGRYEMDFENLEHCMEDSKTVDDPVQPTTQSGRSGARIIWRRWHGWRAAMA